LKKIYRGTGDGLRVPETLLLARPQASAVFARQRCQDALVATWSGPGMVRRASLGLPIEGFDAQAAGHSARRLTPVAVAMATILTRTRRRPGTGEPHM
jgi:hypothetical protein